MRPWYKVPSPLLEKYGGVSFFPWDSTWHTLKEKWVDIGVMYVVSHPWWHNILKFGITQNFNMTRFASYNGCNPTDVTIEFICIVDNVKALEQKIISTTKAYRYRDQKSEWLSIEKSNLMCIITKHLELDRSLMEQEGIPIYHLVSQTETVSNNIAMVKDWPVEVSCAYDPNDEQSIPLSVQNRIFVALFQNDWQWQDCCPSLSFTRVEISVNLEVPQDILKSCYVHLSNLISIPADFRFCGMATVIEALEKDSLGTASVVNDRETRDVWQEKWNDNIQDQVEEYTKEPPPEWFVKAVKRIEQLDRSAETSDVIPEAQHWTLARPPDIADKYVSWTPKEEHVLMVAIREWPNGVKLSWHRLYDQYRHHLNPWRRPNDLANKWRDMNQRARDRIWNDISSGKCDAYAKTGNGPKRTRRKLEDIPSDDIWTCGCEKKYRLSSTQSIQEHIAHCFSQKPKVEMVLNNPAKKPKPT